MKLETTKNNLLEVISKAEKISTRNSTLPVLSCVLLEARNNNLLVRATNLDLGLEVSLPVKVVDSGLVAVPVNTFASFISNIYEDKNVFIEKKNENLVVSTNGAKSTIKTLSAEDFPTLPKTSGGKRLSLPSQDFVRGLRAVWYSAAVTSIKPELSSVYIYSDKGDLVFAATDSFRLAEQKIRLNKDPDIEPVLIPYKNITEIIRILEDLNEDIDIELTGSQVSFSSKNIYLISRTASGNFPDYKQIIPKEAKTEAVVLKQDLLQALKISNIFSDAFHQVSFEIKPKEKKFEMKTRNPDIGESVNRIESAISGEDISINFNYRYILDCLQSINSDSVSLSFNGLSRPLVIRGVSDKMFLYLVMPMNR